MIDTDKYEGHTRHWKWIDINEQDDFYLHSEHGDIINHDTPDGKLAQDAPLFLEAYKRLREENETLRKMDWEYECLWTWLAENTNLLNTIEPLMEEWKKEYDEE